MSMFDKIAAYVLTVIMAFSLGYCISQDNSRAKEVASLNERKCHEVQFDRCWTRIDRLEKDLDLLRKLFNDTFINTSEPIKIEDIATTNSWIFKFEETRDPMDNMPCFGRSLNP